jgi:ankyrin repeat protein
MTNSLPANPSLENLKKQAKTLKKACQRGDADALQRIRAVHPRITKSAEGDLRQLAPRLTDCQLVLAREAGFNSWPQLKVAVESAHQQLPEQFVTIACLCYDDPHYDHRTFHARAHEMLERNRWLTGADVWSAATAGNVGAVKAFLEENPDLVNRPGPHGWTPLLCACYSRVKPVDAGHSTFDVAKLLIDHGADPNTFTWKHNDPPGSDRARRFTALSGLFGGGSTGPANQPPHPRGRELAELLLQRGADPADEMALAINQDACLELLLRHGLKPDAMTRGGITLMGRTLCLAARRGKIDQVRLLLAHGARTDERFDGRIAWEHAMRFGHLDVARVLEEAGAPVAELSERERFVAFCMAGDERGARAMLERNPEVMQQAPKALVHRAVATKRMEAVKLVLDLGFDPNFQEDNAAIHETGPLADNEEIRRLLLDRGASLMLRDPWYDSTGVGWADFFDCRELRDKYLDDGPICLLDALEFKRFDRVPDVLARDPDALERPFAKCISREAKSEDWQTPLVRMVDQGNIDAVRVLLEHGADRSARHPDGRSLVQLARDKGFQEIAELLHGNELD